MELQLFSIEFDNTSKTYYGGQYITGKIVITHDAEIATRGIAVRFSGTAALSWTEATEEGAGDSLRSVVKQHANKEIYMDEELYAFGRAGESEDLVIPPGQQEFPFTYQLPPNVPSTFKFEESQIKAEVVYRVEAKIKKTHWKTEPKTSAEFNVNAVMNVNRYSQATQPVVVFKEKHLCCFCCKDGPIAVNVRLPKTGHFPGDPVAFSVDVSNHSTQRVTGMEVVMEQETRFLSSVASIEKVLSETILRGILGPAVDSKTKESWNGDFTLPNVLPTNLGGCHIIQRSYSLKVTVNIAFSRGIKTTLPIVVGAAPKKVENSSSDIDMKSSRNSPMPNFHESYMPPDYSDVMNL